ncbi:hypothetical protein LF887_10500 [Chryseobacterium sp. MEBOG06]|uniref:hypothetical protein n=1 Tax=Chryseobacterium sp. MEBOG06 TaxID=2879938 RepID=UPI001F2B6BA6|nr:hypothetical protein [Chryseobacterium sp. MEBOG06]UKB86029.1 hypothetical protein LF887_10500 [Chryseobacterium sp. MEBOG06]
MNGPILLITLKFKIMKNITILTVAAITAIMFGCNQTSQKKETNSKADFTEAKKESNDASANENNILKAKTTAEWKQFKTEADNEIAKLDQDLTKLDMGLKKMNTNDKQKFDGDYNQAKKDIMVLKDKLNKKNRAFDSDMKNFGNKTYEENKIFQKDFKTELTKVDLSLKKLIQDDKK